jgi:hypothetical protein
LRRKDRDWIVFNNPTWRDNSDYFICLPQHNKNGQCLHWLNGGDIQWSDHFHEWSDKHNYADDLESQEFFLGNAFMLDDNKFRIKPRKEKRWIGVNNTTQVTTTGLYLSLDDVMNATVRHHEWQFIEIEVEV